jgi:NAD(P)-dependent dehydrogenase (short-subunit alcohol dehydrogenase family)
VRALVVPLGAAGVRVNAVAPGTVPTPATRREWAHVPTHFEDMAALVPTGRLGTPDDVAAAFLVLARDLTHVSGQVLAVDGGQSLHR